MIIVEVRLRGVQQMLAGLARVEKAITTGSVQRVGRQLAKEGEEILRRLTPRQRSTSRLPGSKRGYEPIYRQWERVEAVVTDNLYVAILRNQARDKPGGEALLGSLEYGAREHIIVPRAGKKVLTWWQPRVQRRFVIRQTRNPGEIIEDVFRRNIQSTGTVFADVVLHPGHRPFHMVQRTKVALDNLVGITLANFAREIERSFFGPVSIGVR